MSRKHPLDAQLNVLKSQSLFNADGDRMLERKSGKMQVSAVLQEINQTILGRRLEFIASTGDQLVLDVAGRRVLRLHAADHALNAENLGGDQASELSVLIRDFAVPLVEISVRTAPLAANDEGMNIGLHVTALATLLDVNLDTAIVLKPLGAIDTLLEGLGNRLAAWILYEKGADERFLGDDETVADLRTFIADNRDDVAAQLATTAPDLKTPALLMLSTRSTTANAVIFARADNQTVFGILEHGPVNDVRHAWTQALAVRPQGAA